MVKSASDIKKVLHFQNVLRIAELIRQLKAKNPKATEAEIIAIFEDDYQPEIIFARGWKGQNILFQYPAKGLHVSEGHCSSDYIQSKRGNN